MKKQKLYLVVKIILLIAIVFPIIICIMINTVLKDKFDVYNSTNFIIFLIIEFINIFILIKLINKKDVNNKVFILIICYLIISALISVFHLGYTIIPEGQKSELMGLGLKESYRSIYGINITKLVDNFFWFNIYKYCYYLIDYFCINLLNSNIFLYILIYKW